MMKLLTTLTALTALALCAPSAPAQDEAAIEVMVLGTYHFAGSTTDLHTLDVDDHTSQKRHAEIAQVLDDLQCFAPTKIMVELTPEHEDRFNALFQSYLAGEHELSANERQQIGMALAARLGHGRLYAVDYQNGMDFDAMLSAAQSGQQSRVLADFERFNLRVGQMMAAMGEGSVGDRLILNNSSEVLAMHAGYLVLAQMGSIDNPVGARQMGGWWERNLIIFSNIANHAEPGDRILVVYGSGHKYLLDQFFDEAPGFELVNPLDYLR